jgi:squalene-hopene/tetraprenyl-beta-curcumene cyclase
LLPIFQTHNLILGGDPLMPPSRSNMHGRLEKLGVSLLTVFIVLIGSFLARAASGASNTDTTEKWNPAAAAKYLDDRATWWESWPPSQRDHQTVCVSCHTILPYALSRPRLTKMLLEQNPPEPEKAVLAHIEKRVSLWSQVEPYYKDAESGAGKSRESRSTEAVLNAVILASNAALQKRLDPTSRAAFNAAWALQLRTGEHTGSWDWQVFHLSPWEGTESQYQGAALMALAVAWAPGSYMNDPSIQPNLKSLRSYLKREYSNQPLLNRIVLLWASSQSPGLLSKAQRREIIGSIEERQQADGGWSLPSLGNWSRLDHTSQETKSDGYATGLIVLALEKAQDRDALRKARQWLETHQNSSDGSWSAYSLNKKRDPKTDVGRFMTDAATGYAVLALAENR